MTGVFRAAIAAAVLFGALLGGAGASGASGYTGPVQGVPWSPATPTDATVGLPYSATVSAAPAGAVQVAVACNTRTLTGFPPPPVGLDSCSSLPAGLTATGGSALTISGTPTKEGSFPVRLIAVWKDDAGAYFYALQTFVFKVVTTAASPKCHCSSVSVTVKKVTVTGKTASVTAVLALDCASGSGANCRGTATLRPPASSSGRVAWTALLLPGDARPQPMRGKTTVALSCFAPCGHGATVEARLTASGPGVRAGSRWTIAVVPACAGGRSRVATLRLQFDRSGRLDTRHSKLSS